VYLYLLVIAVVVAGVTLCLDTFRRTTTTSPDPQDRATKSRDELTNH
jgi:hypothetical protein